MTTYTGTAGNDTQNGGGGDDIFDYFQGGHDTLNGKAGTDVFHMAHELDAGDKIDGGTGTDYVQLYGGGAYTATFNNATIKNVEYLQFSSGDYHITTADGNVGAGLSLIILAAASDSMYFDGSAETDGNFLFDTSSGDDTLIGGAQSDSIYGGSQFFNAAVDTLRGMGGDDTLDFKDDFTSADRALGGAGNDTFRVGGGDYSAGVTFAGSTMTGVEDIELDYLGGGHSYFFTFADGNVASGQTLVVTANTAASVHLEGGLETNGRYIFHGSTGVDQMTAGAGNDILQGGGAGDTLDGLTGKDRFAYTAVSNSTGPNYDTVVHFDTVDDLFDLSGTVTGIDTTVAHGSLSGGSFNADLAARVGPGHLAANHAVLFTPDAGGLAGTTFLVVDFNGIAGYQANADLVIRLDSGAHLGGLATTNFV